MFKPVELEVRAQCMVQVAQQVQVERSRRAGGVVVGRVQHRRVLLQIHADDEPPLGANHLRHAGKEGRGAGRLEVADARTGEETHPGQPVGCVRQGERAAVVRAGRAHGEPIELLEDGAGGSEQVGERDVHRHVQGRPARFQQQAGLHARTAAVFDEASSLADGFRECRSVGAQDAGFHPRQVVLRQAGDGIEEARAGGVVEELGRHRLGWALEPGQHLRAHVRRFGPQVVKPELPCAVRRHPAPAERRRIASGLAHRRSCGSWRGHGRPALRRSRPAAPSDWP